MCAQRFTGNRRPLNVAQQAQPPLVIVETCVGEGQNCLVQFDQTIQLSGQPAVSFSDGNNVLNVTQTSPFALLIETDEEMGSDNFLLWPAYDPTVRTFQGGYIAPVSYPVAEGSIAAASAENSVGQAQKLDAGKAPAVEETEPPKSGRVSLASMRAKGRALKKGKP